MSGTNSSPLPRWALEVSAVGADLARSIGSGEFFSPRNILMNGVGMAVASVQGLSAALPESWNRNGWREFANKLSAYRMFAAAGACVAQPRESSVLGQALERVCELDPYAAVWATEGVGYYYAIRGGRLRLAELQALPQRVRIPLHTGAGLAWAEAALRSAPEIGIRRMADEFWERCCAHDSYRELLFEAIGLVAAALYPNLLGVLGHHLADIGDERYELFWHGVGRGLYFLPVGFLPFREARNRAYSLSQSVPSSDAGRRNAIAGVAWALTLVNIRDPEVLEIHLMEHTNAIVQNDAFRNGMTSAMLVWLTASPKDTRVEEISRFQRGDGGRFFPELWESTVRRACWDALRLRGANSGDLPAHFFRVRPLPA
jgi:hypothetical protein